MKDTFDLIIVGSGIVGLSTALFASRTGLRVACIDTFGIGNLANASSDESRLFRLSYYEHPSYVPLLIAAAEAWKSLSPNVFVECGGFYAGPMESELIDGSLKSAIQNGLEHDFLSKGEAAQRFPQFQLPDGFWAIHEKGAGYIRSNDACVVMARQCIEWGVTFLCGEVQHIERHGGYWKAAHTEGLLFGNQIIVAAGMQTAALVPALAEILTPEKHLVRWHVPDNSVDWNQSPGFGIMDEENKMLYGFPANVNMPGVKVGGHQSVNVAGQAEMSRRFLRGLGESACATRACTYDMSPDGHFIVGQIEQGFSVACGFSGHGFKFGSVIGEIVFKAALQTLPPDLQFLSVDRYLIRS